MFVRTRACPRWATVLACARDRGYRLLRETAGQSEQRVILGTRVRVCVWAGRSRTARARKQLRVQMAFSAWLMRVVSCERQWHAGRAFVSLTELHVVVVVNRASFTGGPTVVSRIVE